MFESRITATQKHKSSVTNRNGKAIPFIQPKLTVNQPGDEYEREADEVAERVMRMFADSAMFFRPKPVSSLQRKCAECEKDCSENKQVGNKHGKEWMQVVDEMEFANFIGFNPGHVHAYHHAK